MDYNQFFYDSLTIILQAFHEYLPNDYMGVLKKKYEQVVRPNRSIYVEIFAFSNNKRTKIEQWKFKQKNEATQSHLQRSYSQQNSNDDSELSFSQLNQPNFFKTLQNIRKSIQPKLLLKRMEKTKVVCEIKDKEQELIAFSNGNTFYFEVAEYEHELFQVKLSFKYNYEDEVVALQMNEKNSLKESDSDQFELLVDESYENRLRKESASNLKALLEQNKQNSMAYHQPKQNQKKPTQILSVNKGLSVKNETIQTQKSIRQKRQQEFQQIDKLLKNIDFTTIESTKLKTFLEYLL